MIRTLDKDIDSLRMAVLQTGRSVDETRHIHGDYDEMCKALLERAPDEADTFAVLDDHFPDDVGKYDVFVITGSKHGVYEDHPWIPRLEDLIREAYRGGVKLVGICFGHQIIAQALGGKVEKSDCGFIVGATDYGLVGENGASRTITLYAWHQDQIIKPPADAEIIARSDFCEFAALRYGNKALSFQAHPEFTKEYMADLAEARRGRVITDEMGDEAIASLAKAVDVDVVKQMIAAFLRT